MKKSFFLYGLFFYFSSAMAQEAKEDTGEISKQNAASLDIFSQDTLGIRLMLQGKSFEKSPMFRPTLSYSAQFFEPVLESDRFKIIHGIDAGFSSIIPVSPGMNVTSGLRLGYSEVPRTESERRRSLVSTSIDVGFQIDSKNSRFFELGQTFKCSNVQNLIGESSTRSRAIGKDSLRPFSLGIYMRLNGIFF